VTNATVYAPQGRITIDTETIWYGRISGNSFINARRGVVGAAAPHNINATVTQNQCRITSTGTVGNASRSVIADVASSPVNRSSAVLVDNSLPVPISSTALTTIGTLPTTLMAGNNLIIVVVTFQNTSGVNTAINAGNLQLQRGGTLLTSNQNLIRVVGTNAPAANNFPQDTQFLLYLDSGAAANPTYDIVAQATQNNRISAKVKMVVFNNVPNPYFFDEPANVTLNNGAPPSILSSHATGLPAGYNVILAAVQLDNNAAGGNRTIAANALCLRRGAGVAGPILASNQIAIGLERNGNANEGTGFLLIARDAGATGTGAVANETYTVTGYANNNNVVGEVKMLVFNGLQSAFVSTGTINSIAVAPALTTQSLVTTTFPAGDNIVIAAPQYYNSTAGNRNISADQMIYGALTSTNVTPIYLGVANQVDDYATGLLFYHQNAPANPTYSWQCQANGTNVQADAEIMAIHLITIGSVVDFGWQ
jgi:hypothetical protein